MKFYIVYTDPQTEQKSWTGPYDSAKEAWTDAPAIPTRDCTLVMEPLDEDEFASVLAEGTHTAFRKGDPDSVAAHDIWMKIREMPDAEWGRVMGWLAWGIGESYPGLFRKPVRRPS
jgi:hypothetical protein